MFFIIKDELCYGTADSLVTVDPEHGVLIEHNGEYITTVDDKVVSVNRVWRLPCKIIPYENPTDSLIGTTYKA